MTESTLIFYGQDGKELGRLPVNGTNHFKVLFTNTTSGDRNYTLQVNYEWSKSKQAPDFTKPRGCILK